MAEGISEHYQDWWHTASNEIGLATALALQEVKTITTAAHKIELYSHPFFGGVIVVDDRLYSIEQDAGFHEMLVHVPLLGRQREQCRVLLLGGDGAVLREVLRHDFVTEVVVCEHEPALLEMGSAYLALGAILSEARVRLRSFRAAEALTAFADDGGGFDLIVLRCVNNTTLLSFEAIAACLTDTGVCVDSDWFVLGLKYKGWLRDVNGDSQNLRRLATASTAFQATQFYYATSPWLTGYRGFFLYRKDAHSYAEPYLNYTGSHYNAALHSAAFVLPSFWPTVTT